MYTRTVLVVVAPHVHELIGRQFLQLARFRVTVLAHEIVRLLDLHARI